MIIRAISTIAFVWLMMPHEPDLGLHPNNSTSTTSFVAPVLVCEAIQAGACTRLGAPGEIGAMGAVESWRQLLLEHIEIVRADLNAHGSRIGAPFHNFD
jgi:hypothetical protein